MNLAGSPDSIPVKILGAFTRDAVRALSDDLGVPEGDVLYVLRTDGWGRSVIREIGEMGVKAVITGRDLPRMLTPSSRRPAWNRIFLFLTAENYQFLSGERLEVPGKSLLKPR